MQQKTFVQKCELCGCDVCAAQLKDLKEMREKLQQLTNTTTNKRLR